MRILRSVVVLPLLTALLHAQGVAPPFPTPGYFRTMFTPHREYKLELPGTLRDLVHDGHLRLSLADVTRLVVGRNSDVWLARLDVEMSDSPVLRAFSTFDPLFQGSFSSEFSSSPASSELQASKSLSQQTLLGVQQTLLTGGSYNVSFGSSKLSSNNSFNLLNPSLTAALNVSVSQPLLRGRGLYVQRAPIVIARINRQVARDRFAQSLIAFLQAAQNQYWDTIGARESLAVLRNSLDLAEKSYLRDKRSLELGALPPLDIFRSESEVANRKVQVTSAEYNLKQQEDSLRRLIAADLDPDVRSLPLDLTDSPASTTTLAFPPPDEAVQISLQKRPELIQLRRQQGIYEINERVALNGLKPDLRIGGNYSSNGLGGDNLINGILVPGGFFDALTQAFGFGSPAYGFNVSLNLPLRNRAAIADATDANINYRRGLYQQRSTEQQIALDVRNALNSMEQSRLNIQGATSARDLAQKTMEAEQRRYELGVGTIFLVLDAQQRLSDAQTQLLNAMISFRKAVISAERAVGSLLEDNHVVLEQAVHG